MIWPRGEECLPDNLVLWNTASNFLFDLEGGSNSKATYSVIKNRDRNGGVAVLPPASSFFNFSLKDLPIEEQSFFKILLLIPFGLVLVSFMRIFIGVRTSGTFMPVLLAFAFLETELLPGIIGFFLVVGIGLILRSYLSHLNLLLIARISAVIFSVILIMLLFSILSYKLGISEQFKITYFPIIILSWTIERMSIVYEEGGYREVWIQGGNSILIAILIFFCITSEWVQYYAFNFIGIQFILFALILMIGTYTGYRLLELKRFKPLFENVSLIEKESLESKKNSASKASSFFKRLRQKKDKK